MRTQSVTATSSSLRNITLTIIVTFAVSFAFLYWKQSARQRPILAAPVAMRQAEHPQRTPSLPGTEPARAEAAAPARPAQPTPEPTSDVGGPALPVLYKISERTVRTGDADSPGETARVGEVQLANSSDQPLFITVIDVNLPTMETSQTQIMLGPNAEAQVGADNGLKMQSGDQITLRSPGFSELTFPLS